MPKTGYGQFLNVYEYPTNNATTDYFEGWVGTGDPQADSRKGNRRKQKNRPQTRSRKHFHFLRSTACEKENLANSPCETRYQSVMKCKPTCIFDAVND